MRWAVRAYEDELRELSMASVMAGREIPALYLRRARTALRQMERRLAEDDRYPEPLQPLAPQLGRRVSTRPRRKRYRCGKCMEERLLQPEDAKRQHRKCGGLWELVPRLPPKPDQTYS